MIRSVKFESVKLSVATIIFCICLVICLTTKDVDIKGFFVALTGFLTFPILILSCIDLSKSIRHDKTASKWVRVFGYILGLLQAVIGLLLMLIGIIVPIYEIIYIYSNIFNNKPFILNLIYMVTSLMMGLIGYYYFVAGLRLGESKRLGGRAQDEKS